MDRHTRDALVERNRAKAQEWANRAQSDERNGNPGYAKQSRRGEQLFNEHADKWAAREVED